MSRWLVPVLLALALLAVPGAARAERWDGTDPAGDALARQHTAGDLCGDSTPVETDASAGLDLTGMTVRHRSRTLAVRLGYAAETAVPPHRSVWLHLLTARREMFVYVQQRRDGSRWHVDVGAEPDWTLTGYDADGDGVDDCEVYEALISTSGCPGSEVDVAARSLTVRLPRACLGSPRWVRVGAQSWGSTDDGIAVADVWGTSDVPEDPSVMTYGARVAAPGQSGGPSNRSRVASSETATRRSFVISRTGLPSGTTAATAY